MTINFKEICDKYGNRLYAAAFNICRQQQDAEDVVQECLIRLYQSSTEFESEEHLKAWLLKVTVSTVTWVKRT